MINKEDSAPESSVLLDGNDAFVSKILTTRPSTEQSFSRRGGYFSDNQSGVPFLWEEEPGIPKDPLPPPPPPINIHNNIPDPPTKFMRSPKPEPSSTTLHSISCFFIKRNWFRVTSKSNKKVLMLKGRRNHQLDDIDHDHHDDLFSSGGGGVSKSSSLSSTRDDHSPPSSKGFVLPSSRLLIFVKGFYKRFF